MSKSYKNVNYLLRLKKQIERKMIIDILNHIGSYIDIKKYHYFGLGSVYFADFIMFHKYLGIKKMTSVDDEKDDETRFSFNKPFGFIDFKISDCNSFIQKELDWKDKLFIWLDYDSVVDIGKTNTIEIISTKAKNMDIFLITINVDSPPKNEDIEGFKEKFKEYIPKEIKLMNFAGRNFPGILFNILISAIQNGIRRNPNKLNFLPIFNLVYEDTTKMYTFGVIFCDDKLKGELGKKLSDLFFFPSDNSIIEIDCPLLTPKEKMYCDVCIMKMDINYDKAKDIGLKKDEIDKYCKFYKYYPQFFESIY